MDIRHFLFRYRSYTPLPMFAVAIWFGEPTALSLGYGLFAAIIGEAIRLWGVAYAGSETRTTMAPGGTKLITTGAFAYVRNPLYLGNIILYTGIGIMTNNWWIVLAGYVFFQIQYALIISAEEEFLEQAYGDAYRTYKIYVHRYIPRLTPYQKDPSTARQFDILKGLLSERRTFQAIMATFIIMSVLAYWKG